MKISHKLILGFVGISLIAGIVIYLSGAFYLSHLTNAIGAQSVTLSRELLHIVVSKLQSRIEQVRIYAMGLALEEALSRSNALFDARDDRFEYINRMDNLWRAAPEEAITPFMGELIHNDLSEKMRREFELSDYYEETLGHIVFGEMFVTNKYGANIAQTRKTSDYNQSDETWWQVAKREGLYAGPVIYDESAGIYALEIAVRMDTAQSGFMGVMKAVLNIKEVWDLVKSHHQRSAYSSAEFMLLSKEGRVIIDSAENHRFLEDMAHSSLFRNIRDDYGFFLKAQDDDASEKLIAYCRSATAAEVLNYLNWIAILEIQTDEIFSTVQMLKKSLIAFSLIVFLVAVFCGIILSRTISIPINQLKEHTIRLGNQELEARIEISPKNELGQLANAFNRMARELLNTTVSKKFLDNIVNNMVEMLIIIGPDGKITLTNQAARSLSGYSEEELQEAYLDRILEVGDTVTSNMGGGERESHRFTKWEGCLVTRDRGKVPIRYSNSIALNPDGSTAYRIIVAHDITQRKQAEASLRESEEKFRLISETAHDAVIMLDEKGRISYWNNAAVKIFGYSHGEIQGKNLRHLLIPQRYRAAYQMEFDKFKQNCQDKDVGRTLELSALRKDGTEFPIEISASATLIKGSWTAIGILRDVTKRKRVEKALRKSEQSFHAIINKMPGGVLIVDKDGIVLFANYGVTKLFGKKAEDIIGHPFGLPITYDDRTEIDIFLDDRQKRVVEMIVVETNWLGESASLATLFDITAIKEAEKVLRKANEQLLNLNTMKNDFIAMTSHELRTPLNSILLLSKLLSENKYGNLSAKQIEYAQTINNSGTDLLKLINEILDLSKVEAGKMEYFVSEVDLNLLVEKVQRKFTELADKKGLGFRVDLHDDIPRLIHTDVSRLEQIVDNLIANAIKFTDKGSVGLTIRRPEKNVRFLKKGLRAGEALAFMVTDTGIGIEEQMQKVVFEAFKQVDSSTNRKYGGTGLGLSISRELASGLGGEIQLVSKAGTGSTFTLYLPERADREMNFPEKKLDGLEPSQPPAADATGDDENRLSAVDKISALGHNVALSGKSKPAADESALKDKKILIVDDDMRNVFALTSILESEGIQVVAAKNGREGIACVRNTPDLDLILMDIMMPEMNGYEAIKQIQALGTDIQLPIIALTAKAMQGDREKCMEAGAKDYLSKPVDNDKLFSMLKEQLCG